MSHGEATRGEKAQPHMVTRAPRHTGLCNTYAHGDTTYVFHKCPQHYLMDGQFCCPVCFKNHGHVQLSYWEQPESTQTSQLLIRAMPPMRKEADRRNPATGDPTLGTRIHPALPAPAPHVSPQLHLLCHAHKPTSGLFQGKCPISAGTSYFLTTSWVVKTYNSLFYYCHQHCFWSVRSSVYSWSEVLWLLPCDFAQHSAFKNTYCITAKLNVFQ